MTTLSQGIPLEASPVERVDCASISKDIFEFIQANKAELEQDALDIFQRLIKIDTQNFGDDGTEIEAVKFIKEKFDEVGVEYEIVEPKPGRGNIIARVRGDGSSDKGAVLLNSHLDTVRAPHDTWREEGWKHDPYGAVIDQDGCLYGRGTIDMKNMAAMCVALFRFIKRKNFFLSRDLIFAGVADEERTDSTWGARYLVENRPELVEADVVFSEVGGFTMSLMGKEVMPIQIAEKGTAVVKITAHGPGGHGSLFHEVNPIATIGEVAQTLHNNHLPLRVNTANRATVNSMANCMPFPVSFCFNQVLNPLLSNFFRRRFLTEDQESSIGPLLHNTANPILVGGGDQMNQIPTTAWLIVDCRFLPECTVEELMEEIRQLVDPSRFQIPENSDQIQPELTIECLAYNDPCWQDPNEAECKHIISVLSQVLSLRGDGTSILTNLIPAGTDFVYYSKHPTKSPVCLGFTPVRIPVDMNFAALFHSTNERVPVEGFFWGTKILAEVTLNICSAKLF